MPKEISKWPRRNGLSARKRRKANVHRPWPCAADTADRPLRPGRLPSTSKGIAWERAGAARGLWLCCVSTPSRNEDWPADAPCQRPLGAATISEISFGICSRQKKLCDSIVTTLRVARRLPVTEALTPMDPLESLASKLSRISPSQGRHMACGAGRDSAKATGSQKEIRETLRALYKKTNQGPSGALHNDTKVEISHS